MTNDKVFQMSFAKVYSLLENKAVKKGRTEEEVRTVIEWLTGYDAAIKETGRLTDEKIEMDEEALNILNMKFQILVDSLDEEPEVTFTYFKPDERKAGGAYIEVTGTVKKVDDFERLIVMQNGMKIPMDDILNIEGHIFASLQ